MSNGNSVRSRPFAFPSPRGDKLCRAFWLNGGGRCSLFPSPRGDKLCPGAFGRSAVRRPFPSPRGDKLCHHAGRTAGSAGTFPSPRGDKLCRDPRRAGGILHKFPSPRGDKLCLQNCPTGACGIGPGSDRITISHSTATGKWQLEIKIPLIFLREPLQTAMQVAAMETRFAQSADSH